MTDELNPDQKRAAGFKDGICAVIAVPGSGQNTDHDGANRAACEKSRYST